MYTEENNDKIVNAAASGGNPCIPPASCGDHPTHLAGETPPPGDSDIFHQYPNYHGLEMAGAIGAHMKSFLKIAKDAQCKRGLYGDISKTPKSIIARQALRDKWSHIL